MSRYIDADNVIEQINDAIDFYEGDAQFVLGIYEAKDIIESAPTVGEWISVKNELPENDDPVLVYTNSSAVDFPIRVACFDGTEGGWWDIEGYEMSVLYWMPLPKAPKEEEE